MPVKPRSLLKIAMVVLLVSGTGSAAGEAPDFLSYPGADYVIWISAEAAEKKGGAPENPMHREAVENIDYILAQSPVAGCQEAGPMILELAGGRHPPRSLEDAARSYPNFGYGKVREMTPGFVIGEAGHLVTVEVTEVSRGIKPGQKFLVFIPIGDFTFRGKKICKRDPRYAGLPRIGDELLVFADRPVAAMNGLWTVDYPEAIILISGGKVLLAPALEKAAKEVSSKKDSKMLDRAGLVAQLPLLESMPNEKLRP